MSKDSTYRYRPDAGGGGGAPAADKAPMARDGEYGPLKPKGLPATKLLFGDAMYVQKELYNEMVNHACAVAEGILMEVRVARNDSQGKQGAAQLKGMVAVKETLDNKQDDDPHTVYCGQMLRTEYNISWQDSVYLSAVNPKDRGIPTAQEINFYVSPHGNRNQNLTVNAEELGNKILEKYAGRVYKRGHQFLVNDVVTSHVPCRIVVEEIMCSSPDQEKSDERGLFSGEETAPKVYKAANANLTLIGSSSGQGHKVFNTTFDQEKLNIGGLGKEFGQIFKRAFSSRLLPPKVVEQMGLPHVRGMLLYGPPGCGKTLIARELGKALNAHKPKVINGPEILNKYVGQSEENIRDLFQEAEAEQEQKGNNSSLHIIIFDEIDAICKQRGSVGGGTGVHDSVVNQLLSKMDGVNSLNNILVIGMTNRKDMIDSALLRPGRFEVKLEIPLPNKEGRKEILKIHTQQLREHGYLGNVSLDLIAEQTKNFTGAEIQGLVKEARSNALGRVVTPNDPEQKTEKQIKEQLRVEQFDFIAARKAIEPQFGIREDELVELYEEHGIIEYGEKFISMKSGLNDALERVKQNEDHSTVISVCLCSGHGSGKTAFTASFAQKSEVSFVKRIGADTLAGMSEQQKISAITTAFHDAYRSEQSVIILDDIERLIDYVKIGGAVQFSNQMLQLLMVLVNQKPPSSHNLQLETEEEQEEQKHKIPGKRLMVVATTTIPDVLEQMGLLQVFDIRTDMPVPRNYNEFYNILQQKEVFKQAAQNDDEKEKECMKQVAQYLHEHGRELSIKKLLVACALFQGSSRENRDADAEEELLAGENTDSIVSRFKTELKRVGVSEPGDLDSMQHELGALRDRLEKQNTY